MNIKINYMAHEAQRAALEPVSKLCKTLSTIFKTTNSSSIQSKYFSAGCELYYRLTKSYDKPNFDLTQCSIEGQLVPIHETVAYALPFCRLIHFRKESKAKTPAQPTVLIVSPLSGHHSTLLKDTVSALLPFNDVYITDWTDAKLVSASKGRFGLDEYVEYIKDFLSRLGGATHVVAVCQPTVPVLAAVSLLASEGATQPRTITLLAGPIDTRNSPTQVNEFAEKHPLTWFESNLIDVVPPQYPGAGRKVYPGFVQHAAFVSMNPESHYNSHLRFFNDMIQSNTDKADAHRKFYDEYNAVLDMPAEFYLETINVVFKEKRLAKNEWKINGKEVRPEDIKIPALLTVEGENDDICGPGQTKAAADLCSNIPSNRKCHHVVGGAGHYGVFSGSKWREFTAPLICDFIRRHN